MMPGRESMAVFQRIPERIRPSCGVTWGEQGAIGAWGAKAHAAPRRMLGERPRFRQCIDTSELRPGRTPSSAVGRVPEGIWLTVEADRASRDHAALLKCPALNGGHDQAA